MKGVKIRVADAASQSGLSTAKAAAAEGPSPQDNLRKTGKYMYARRIDLIDCSTGARGHVIDRSRFWSVSHTPPTP